MVIVTYLSHFCGIDDKGETLYCFGRYQYSSMVVTSIAGKNWSLLVSAALALLGLIVFRMFLNWDSLGFTVQLQNLTSLLAPLAFTAAVIERAVEIVVSPWRDAEASKLDGVVAAIKARPADPAANAQNAADLIAATDRLNDYRGDTQRYAFAVSLILSVLASISGVRALGPFVDSKTLTPDFSMERSTSFFSLWT